MLPHLVCLQNLAGTLKFWEAVASEGNKGLQKTLKQTDNRLPPLQSLGTYD